MAAPSVSKDGILNPNAGARHFRLERYEPAADLAFFVERHWIVRWDLRAPYEQENLPHPCVNVVVEAGRSAVHGVGTRKFHVRLEGRGQVVGVKFKPGGFLPWTRLPMRALVDRPKPLCDVFGDAAAALEPAVLALEDDAAQIALVEAFLRARIPPRDERCALVASIVATALAERDLTRAEDLAARAGLSLRALQRLFHAYVGVGPKWVLRRLRMQDAAARAAEGTSIDWARMALELGYCDQAHFARDFKAQVGRTPAEYANACVTSR
jgi:AraC-like DNA-binding protein